MTFPAIRFQAVSLPGSCTMQQSSLQAFQGKCFTCIKAATVPTEVKP